MANDDIYSSGKAGSLTDRMVARGRRKMFDILAGRLDLDAVTRILDVGVTADRSFVSSNYFEDYYPHKDRITALSDQDARWLEEVYPGLSFVQGDGRKLPFRDNSFDLVFSSAVIEHVGSLDNQIRFFRECCRVSRGVVFLTTPNRWHPIEFHSVLPLLHWFPKTWHRFLLRRLGRTSLSSEEALNLLSTSDLRKICREVNIHDFDILHARFLGVRSNLLLLARL